MGKDDVDDYRSGRSANNMAARMLFGKEYDYIIVADDDDGDCTLHNRMFLKTCSMNGAGVQ